MTDIGADVADKLRQFGDTYMGVAGEFWRVLERAGGMAGSGAASGSSLNDELERLRKTMTAGLFGPTQGGSVPPPSGTPFGMPGFGSPGFGMPGFSASGQGWPGFGMPGASIPGFPPGFGNLVGGNWPGFGTGAAAPGAELLELWQRLAAGFQSAPYGATPGSVPNMPAIGLTRERQEALQRLAQALTAYQQDLGRFAQLWSAVGARAIELLTERIRARLERGEQYENLRAVYDSWIDCAEEAYAGQARSTEFMQLQAALCNSFTAVRGEQQGMVEQLARDFDLPTRAELNTVHRTLKTLRKELAELRRAHEGRPKPSARSRTPTAS